MKLATYKDGSRDGQLVVVSQDLSLAHYATGIAPTLQRILDDWNFLSPQLQDLSICLNQGRARHAFPFETRRCMAPLPRAFQRLSRVAHSAILQMSQQRSDALMGPCDPITQTNRSWGLAFDTELAAITEDVAMGCSYTQALESVRLLVLVQQISMPHLEAPDAATVWSQLACAFSPVAVTTDELGPAWSDGRVHLKLGQSLVSDLMSFDFGELIAHLCSTRELSSGSIVGSGSLSRYTPEHQPDKPLVRCDIRGLDGQSVFGALDLTLPHSLSVQS
jgi:fumarylacetoacetate (FAA) hydrolase